MNTIIKDFIREEKGQTIIEWIMILVLILIAVMTVMGTLGKSASKKTSDINNVIK